MKPGSVSTEDWDETSKSDELSKLSGAFELTTNDMNSKKRKKDSSSPVAAATFSIFAYMLSSVAIVYFNWWVFNSSFKYPVFVSWFQQIVGFLLYYIFAFVGVKTGIGLFLRFRWIRPSFMLAVKMLPLSISFVGQVSLANLCLQLVQVSTYQVARSLTLVFTLLMSFLILNQRETSRVLASCLITVLGFLLNALDPQTLSAFGVIFGGTSSLAQSTYNVLIKYKLPLVDNDQNILLMYNQLNSIILFVPAIFLAGETNAFIDFPWSNEDPQFAIKWVALLGSGALGMAINLASYMCVKYTSPLTFNITGFAKSVFQSAGGFVFLGDTATTKGIVSLVLSLFGTGWYSCIKYAESQTQMQSLPTPIKSQHVEEA